MYEHKEEITSGEIVIFIIMIIIIIGTILLNK